MGSVVSECFLVRFQTSDGPEAVDHSGVVLVISAIAGTCAGISRASDSILLIKKTVPQICKAHYHEYNHCCVFGLNPTSAVLLLGILTRAPNALFTPVLVTFASNY